MPANRSKRISRPPADGSASVDGGVRFTPDDLNMFAHEARLPMTGITVGVLEKLDEVVDFYVLSTRMQKTSTEKANAPGWGKELALWAGSGRMLLGDIEPSVVYLAQAMTHLCSAFPHLKAHEERTFSRNCYMAVGLDFIDNRHLEQTKVSVINSLLDKTAHALRSIEILGEKVQVPDIKKGKQTDYARLKLIRGLKDIFLLLFPATPFSVVTRKKEKHPLNERGAYPGGPAVHWCRAVLTTAADRVVKPSAASLPEVSELKEWAARPDALPKVIRKINAKSSSKTTG